MTGATSINAETIDGLILAAAANAPSKPALLLPDRVVTFDELARASRDLAARLGNGPGAVAILAKDKAEAMTGLLAALISDRPGSLLDPARPEHELSALISDLRPGIILRDGLVPEPGPNDPRETAPDDFYWGFSSGTTGRPKPFARNHRSWVESFAALDSLFPFHEDDVIALPGSIAHSLFLFGALHGLAKGLSVAAPAHYTPRAVARHFAEAGASVMWCVPVMLQTLTRFFDEWQPRLIFCGGAKLSAELRQQVERSLPGSDLVEFYGSSELSFVSYASTSRPAPADSVGYPFPSVDIRIVDEDGGELPAHARGVIEVRSPMCFSRYLSTGSEDDCPADEWVGAGDLGYLDEGGRLYLTGRVARVINVSGLKVPAETIEAALGTCPLVKEAVVFGLPDALRGEAIAAVILPAGEVEGRSALLSACREPLAPAQTPRRIFLADELARTYSGKVAIAEVRRMALRGDPALRELKE